MQQRCSGEKGRLAVKWNDPPLRGHQHGMTTENQFHYIHLEMRSAHASKSNLMAAYRLAVSSEVTHPLNEFAFGRCGEHGHTKTDSPTSDKRGRP